MMDSSRWLFEPRASEALQVERALQIRRIDYDGETEVSDTESNT